MNKRIYISGKISNEQRLKCWMKFQSAQSRLEDRGFEVVNPVGAMLDPQADREEVLADCLIAIQQCTALYMLPDWKESSVARLEACFAHRQGIWLIYENIEKTVR